MGCAPCVWDDLGRLTDKGALADKFDFIAINNVIPFIPFPIQHVASYHAEFLPHWLEIRRLMVHKKEPHIHSHGAYRNPKPPVSFMWDFEFGGGSSGMLATLIGLAIGYRQVILAGVPLDDSHRFHDCSWAKVAELSHMHGNYLSKTLFIEWHSAMETIFDGRVKSMSGRTREWLGEP